MFVHCYWMIAVILVSSYICLHTYLSIFFCFFILLIPYTCLVSWTLLVKVVSQSVTSSLYCWSLFIHAVSTVYLTRATLLQLPNISVKKFQVASLQIGLMIEDHIIGCMQSCLNLCVLNRCLPCSAAPENCVV